MSIPYSILVRKFKVRALRIIYMNGELAAWINAKVTEKGWTLRYAARRSGVSHTTLIRVANGEAHPSARVCQGLAAAFGVSNEDVFRLGGFLPEVITDQRAIYTVGDNRSERLAAAFGRLGVADQELVVMVAERLAGIVEPRIIGDETVDP